MLLLRSGTRLRGNDQLGCLSNAVINLLLFFKASQFTLAMRVNFGHGCVWLDTRVPIMGGHCGQVWVIVESTQGLSLRGPCQKQLLPCSSGLLNVHTRPRNKCMTSA